MNTGNLTFSIIVNTLDRAQPLQTLLRALEHQSYPLFEVIVVVGPTRDDTLQMLSRYGDRVRVLRCPTANLSRSRNIGLLAARGDIVAFLDDDAIPSQRWLEQLAHLFRDPALDATGGAVYTLHPDYSIIQHRLGITSSLSEQVDVRADWTDQLVPPGMGSQWVTRMMGTNMAFRRRVLVEAGGFDEFYGYIAEETDLTFRLTSAGRNVFPVKETAVYHIPASSRNRTVFTNRGKWWLRSRSRVYFGIKNGLAAGDPLRKIALRSIMDVGAHWWWYEQMRRDGQLSLLEVVGMDWREFFSGLNGAIAGVLRRRQLISSTAQAKATYSAQAIQVYQTPQSQHQPSVDPITGTSPSISLPEQPLRICLLSGAYPPSQYDGIGRWTNLLAQGLFELGHTVHVIARGERDQISFYDGAYVHRVVPRLERYGQYLRYHNLYHTLNHSHTVYEQVRRLVLNDGIQIVDSPLWQFEGLVTARSKMLPVVVRIETSMRQIASLQRIHDRDLLTIGDLERAFLEQAAALVPNSHAVLRAAEEACGMKLVSAVKNITPIGIIPASEDAIRPFNLQDQSKPRTVLYVGRLEKRKGTLDLFQAIPLVLNKLPDTRFVIAGGDNSRNDGFRQKSGTDYPTYFATHYSRYTSSVKFTGPVNDDQLRDLYQACDLFVAPSLYESFGLIYIEAMNYAKPVIGCRAGGIPEVVDDGITGLLVDPAAPTALADAIVRMLESPARLREFGLAGREQLLQRFTHIQMARRFEQVYRQAIRAFQDHSERSGLSSEEQ